MLTLAAAVGAVALTSVAVATPASGILSGTVFARASFLDPVDIKVKVASGNQDVIHVQNARETVMQQIVFGPGGHSGWHSHPGPAIALIKSGELTLYTGDDPTCTGRTYSPNEAFVDSGQGHGHMARNLSNTENLEVWVTYFDVPPGQPARVDVPDPGNCPF